MAGNPFLRAAAAVLAAAAVVVQALYPSASWSHLVIMAVTAALGVLQGALPAKQGAQRFVEWLLKGSTP